MLAAGCTSIQQQGPYTSLKRKPTCARRTDSLVVSHPGLEVIGKGATFRNVRVLINSLLVEIPLCFEPPKKPSTLVKSTTLIVIGLVQCVVISLISNTMLSLCSR